MYIHTLFQYVEKTAMDNLWNVLPVAKVSQSDAVLHKQDYIYSVCQ